MTVMKSVAATLVVLFPVLLAAEAHARAESPKAVLQEIYGQVDAMCGGDGNGPAYDIVGIANTYFEPTLAKKVGKISDGGPFDFDFLVDAQDCQVTALDLSVVDDNGSTATGHAEFQNFGERRSIDLKMAKHGETLEVTDVVYRHRPFSLRAGE